MTWSRTSTKATSPNWDLYVQVLKPEDLAKFDFDPTGCHQDLAECARAQSRANGAEPQPGQCVPETEQVAMADAGTGYRAVGRPRCKGRVFSYADTQMYRLGANALQLPINAPRVTVNNGNQDGAMNFGKTTTGVNYQPSRLLPREEPQTARYSQAPLSSSATGQDPA